MHRAARSELMDSDQLGTVKPRPGRVPPGAPGSRLTQLAAAPAEAGLPQDEAPFGRSDQLKDTFADTFTGENARSRASMPTSESPYLTTIRGQWRTCAKSP